MSKLILHLDDSSTQRVGLVNALTEAGHTCLEAEDGVEGIAVLEKNRGKKFDLIICDLNMPNMNGFEFVAKIKADDEWKSIPVIMLTTEASDAMKDKGLELGVKAWALKPCAPAKLIKALEKLA